MSKNHDEILFALRDGNRTISAKKLEVYQSPRFQQSPRPSLLEASADVNNALKELVRVLQENGVTSANNENVTPPSLPAQAKGPSAKR